MSEGRLLAGVANAVFALYGEPEPEGWVPLDELADKLYALARERREEQQ
jgi:hypothetical protein